VVIGYLDAKAYRMIDEVAKERGIPSHILKVAILMESSGKWDPDQPYRKLPHRDNAIIMPYVGLFLDETTTMGFDPEEILTNQRMQIDALGAKIRYLKMADEWSSVFKAIYQGMKYPDVYTGNAMAKLKKIASETS
jgi:hypothetical protein